MATPFKFGHEFLVNTTTDSTQSYPTTTGLTDGRFVISWQDFSMTGGDTSGYAVRAQIFNADGSKSGQEFLVNSTTYAGQENPTITALADGRFVVSWQAYGGPGITGEDIRAQVFNADGSKLGSEFLVNSTTTNSQSKPTITTLADGRFVVSWQDLSETSTAPFAPIVSDIRSQIFNADGSKSGAEFLVNTTTTGKQHSPSITALTDGRFVVSWADRSAGGTDPMAINVSDIRAQIFNADGSKSGGEFLVNTTTTNDQQSPSITALVGGGFVVSWSDYSQSAPDSSVYAVRAQVFNDDGTKSGLEFLVNTTTPDHQYLAEVAALPDGRFVVTWMDESRNSGDSSGAAIRAQLFNDDGTKSGVEFLVNSTTKNAQLIPSITSLADGRFVISWIDRSKTGGDTSNEAIRGQIFDPREAAVALDGTALADDFIGTRFGDWMRGAKGDDLLQGRAGKDTLSGGLGSDNLDGGRGSDDLTGGRGNDDLTGGLGEDKLIGDQGRDGLHGGLGKDLLTGGDGADRFVFTTPGETGTSFAERDTIKDFDQTENDRIVLTQIDARSASGDQAFRFIGTAAFSGTEGELRYKQTALNTIIKADIDGDRTPDFEITVFGLHDLTAGDFLL